MSLTATLNNALSGLTMAQHALSLTAHNIVNANTEGYSRKQAAAETQVVANRGAGVRAGDVERVTDRFLAQEVRRQANTVGEIEILDRFHGMIQDFLGSPGENNDVATRIAGLGAALEALAANPETSALRIEVVNLANALGSQIDGFAQAIQRLRGDADQEIGLAAREINGELAEIARLNQEIVRLSHIDQSNPELLDKRDALVKSLSEKIDLSTYVTGDGALMVQTGDGTPLVDETARVLIYEPAQQVSAGTTFGALRVYHPSQLDAAGQPVDPNAGTPLISSGVRRTLSAELQNDATPDADQLVTSRIRSGRMAGLLEVRDQVLPELDDQIRELADGLRFALNRAHNDGVAYPPPSVLTGSRTDLSAFAGAVRSGSATIAVIDRTSGGTMGAFQIDLGVAADENAVVAGINAGLGALGSASIAADGRLQIALTDPAHGLAVSEGDSRVAVQDAAGRSRDYGFAHYFGLNDLLVTTRGRASSIAVRPEVASNPGLISIARLDVASGPPLQALLGGSGDNRSLQGLAATLRSGHEVIARGSLPARTTSFGAYAADIIGQAAITARQVSDTATNARAFGDALEFRAAAVSGVNVDEEMSRLVQLQKAYTVSARIIAVTDEMFDELFRAAQ